MIEIKFPQLLGILAGCLVFTITISIVIILLYKSGTFSRFIAEIQSGKPLELDLKKSILSTTVPELYDHLIEASNNLPLRPVVKERKGRLIFLRDHNEKDNTNLFLASNGSPQYHESAYDPIRIWAWLGISGTSNDPSSSIETFQNWTDKMKYDDCSRSLTIVDNEIGKPIGMICLSQNSPMNLSINIEYLWITPAFQGKHMCHEAMLFLLQELFTVGYRRVTCHANARHLILKKFIERCGFKLEAVLRKHRIINKRNIDTAVYTLLNSDWNEEEIKLKRYLGLPLNKTHKIAEIELSKSEVIDNSDATVEATVVTGVKDRVKKRK